MRDDRSVQDLIDCFYESPYPSLKVTNYFRIYADLFAHLRNTPCTFIETGVLNGGSLFMWRRWLGDQARIIGVDLNPEAKKWEEFGFEIVIGDQGDPDFWRNFHAQVGQFDVLLDDGGHQSFQQIVTLTEAIHAAKKQCLVVIEDTQTSFFKEFSGHGKHSFLEYAKASTDTLIGKGSDLFPEEMPEIVNSAVEALYAAAYSVRFYSGIVAYEIDPIAAEQPTLVWNRAPEASGAADFRYEGRSDALVEWPTLFERQWLRIRGGQR